MSRENVLARVEADIARCDYERAKSRLHTLLRDAPADLDIRERLAAVYRRAGNPVEAGRWSYLGERVETERAAFVRAYPDPRHRLDALRWVGPADQAPARIQALAEEISRTVKPERRTRELEFQDYEHDWSEAVFAVIALALLGLCGIGLVTVVRWVVL